MNPAGPRMNDKYPRFGPRLSQPRRVQNTGRVKMLSVSRISRNFVLTAARSGTTAIAGPSESGRGQPHSKTLRNRVASRLARQRLGVRLSSAALDFAAFTAVLSTLLLASRADALEPVHLAPYPQKFRTFYKTNDPAIPAGLRSNSIPLPVGNIVTSAKASDAALWLGTTQGLMRLDFS